MKELYTVYGLVGEVISIADKGLVYKDTTIPFNNIEKVVKLGNANVKKGVIIQIFVHDYSEPIEVFYTDKNEKLTEAAIGYLLYKSKAPYIPTNNQKADSNDDSYTSATDTKFTSTDESYENDTSQDAAIPSPSDKTKYQVVQQVVTTDKKLRPRSVVGLIVGWAIIFYSFYMFYQIHYASNSDSWAALGKAISGSMIQNTMVSTFWAGVACVAAYRLRCKYLHWLGCVLSVTAILQLPSITDIPILQIVAVVLPICAYTADTTAEVANESLKAKGKAQK